VSLVLHSSVVIAWYFEDGNSAETDAVLDRVASDGAMVLAHWRADVGDAFQRMIQENQTDAIYRDTSLAELALLPITIDADTNTYAWSATLRIAERFSLSTHEESDLELTHRLALPFATLDEKLDAFIKELGGTAVGWDTLAWRSTKLSRPSDQWDARMKRCNSQSRRMRSC
jgi:predicted nucleic acid-binding protein